PESASASDLAPAARSAEGLATARSVAGASPAGAPGAAALAFGLELVDWVSGGPSFSPSSLAVSGLVGPRSGASASARSAGTGCVVAGSVFAVVAGLV